MSPVERANLRIKCVDVFVQAASKLDIEKGRVFELGEQLWKFATEIPQPSAQGHAATPPGGQIGPSASA